MWIRVPCRQAAVTEVSDAASTSGSWLSPSAVWYLSDQGVDGVAFLKTAISRRPVDAKRRANARNATPRGVTASAGWVSVARSVVIRVRPVVPPMVRAL
jgi:hypothetical protein